MFVRPEIGPLKRRFDRVIIAPCDTTGPNVDPDSGCEIDTTLTKLLGRGSKDLLRNIPLAIKSSSRSIYFLELATAFIRYGPKGLRRAVSWSLRAAVASYWATSRFNTDDAIVFYTYWNTGITKGVSEAARSVPNWSVVTRTHGFDLYYNRETPPYLPFRPQVFYDLDRIYTIAKHGYDFLVEHGAPSKRLALARLGIPDPGFRNHFSTDSTFRVVSCSFLVAVKRVALLARSLCYFARSFRNVQIEWNHVGDGPERAMIESILETKPVNLKACVRGQMSNENVFRYYRDNCSDLLINLSESEGIPVTMMEACGIGLPIIATNVGGVSEIVSSKNGILLPADVSEKEVASAINEYYRLPLAKKVDLSNGARSVWSAHFDAERNHSEFADSLLDLSRNEGAPLGKAIA